MTREGAFLYDMTSHHEIVNSDFMKHFLCMILIEQSPLYGGHNIIKLLQKLTDI